MLCTELISDVWQLLYALEDGEAGQLRKGTNGC